MIELMNETQRTSQTRRKCLAAQVRFWVTSAFRQNSRGKHVDNEEFRSYCALLSQKKGYWNLAAMPKPLLS